MSPVATFDEPQPFLSTLGGISTSGSYGQGLFGAALFGSGSGSGGTVPAGGEFDAPAPTAPVFDQPDPEHT